ncbi:3260_t:CDS:2 [Ambispora gerdemannii]|uniref:3260_t:CDS:1 n=1 Tax=Ambispora gerdemannii TaxID=144530 RepID=A0A9N8YVV7_9GLOM|nr:3260_t:CDS:2 [Ambispora gerdemannii]
MKVDCSNPPKEVLLWHTFFEEVNQFDFDQRPEFQESQFKRPQFFDFVRLFIEEEVRYTFMTNVCIVLNGLMKSDYKFSRRPTCTSGIPDFNGHYINKLILTIEMKRELVLKGIGEATFPEFYNENNTAKMVIQQSEPPTVLKAYAYIALRARPDHISPHPDAILSASSTVPQEQNFSFEIFKFKSILGEGRSGKTLLCEFCGNTIVLKSTDLSKTPPHILEEMQKEVEIYKILADIQGKYISKLMCYGYYSNRMSFVIGMTLVGTTLNDHKKITEWQKIKTLEALKAIYEHGILHNDIREENILVNDNGDMYVIDFGMASRADLKKKRKLFHQEQLELSHLLNLYIV